MSDTDAVLVEYENAVAWIRFNRPERLNAVTTPMLEAAAIAVETAAADATIRAIVLTGVGRAFSAGADATGEEASSGPDPVTLDTANRLTRALRAAPKPVLAAVNGPAVGAGCSFALAADLTVARESAFFLLAFTNMGLMPDAGSTAVIPALVGFARAARMALLAERIPAKLAAEWGLIGQVLPDDEFDSAVADLAARLAAGPTLAYALTKQAFNATALATLETALSIERSGQEALYGTADFAEGVAAFQHKRPAIFTGK